jgi:hypothetical protein
LGIIVILTLKNFNQDDEVANATILLVKTSSEELDFSHLHYTIKLQFGKKQALGGLIINKRRNHTNANWCQEDFLELLVV